MIEVGEFVRTFNGLIGKVVELTDSGNYAIRIYNGAEYVVRAVIKKHSKDLTDLIEVGDVIEIHFPVRNTIRKIYVDEYFEDSMILNGIINGNVILKTILTKEMYEANCYTVERKKKDD